MTGVHFTAGQKHLLT